MLFAPTRYPCTTPNCTGADVPLDWVIAPSTTYRTVYDGATLFTSNAEGLINFPMARRIDARTINFQLGATADTIIDLADDVDPERDHIRGPVGAPVTLVEYGDFECPYCVEAGVIIEKLRAKLGDDLRYVFRNLPLADVHPNAQMAAEAAEAAGDQDRY